MLRRMRISLIITVPFLMSLVHLFLKSLNVNTVLNKCFLSMKSKCVAAFEVGWLIFEQKTSCPSYFTDIVTRKKIVYCPIFLILKKPY